MESVTKPFGRRLRRWVGRAVAGARERTGAVRGGRHAGDARLRGAYDTYAEEFEARTARADEVGVTEFFWRDEVLELLGMVEEALAEGRVDDGWHYLHAARRAEVYGLEAIDAADPEANALEARASAVRSEALGELDGWRKRAVEALLGRDQLDPNVTGEEVRKACELLHEQYERVHLKRHYLQQQFNQLFWLGLAGGFAFLVLSALPSFVSGSHGLLGPLVGFLEPPFGLATGTATAQSSGPDVSSGGFAVFVGLAGVVGASLFGMRSLRRQARSTHVAQRITGLTLTWTRGFLGAVSALVFYYLLQTPFVTVGGNTAAVMLVVGFAAGYSERMVVRAVETVSGAVELSEAG
ncbi:MAG: hypothetical protein ABEJ04_00865 [Halobacteriaceae archaeon]